MYGVRSSPAGPRAIAPPGGEIRVTGRMRYAVCAAVLIETASPTASAAWAQTSVIRQSDTVNHEASSVTVSGQWVAVDISASAGRVVGNGQPASEMRSIDPVTTIAADGAFALTVKVGATPGLTIETDKNLLPIVKTDMSNGRLDLYTDRSYSVDGRIKVTVTSPTIADISASGQQPDQRGRADRRPTIDFADRLQQCRAERQNIGADRSNERQQ